MFPTQPRSAAASTAPARPTRRPATRVAATSTARALVAGAVLLAASGGARALDDQWYIGLGGGAAFLRPDAVDPGLDTDEEPVPSGTLFVGRDLDERTSVQLQLHGLGETEFEDGRTAAYVGGDASVLYRFFDSRDRAPRGTVFGASLYGRFGLGFMDRDTDVALEGDADVNFGAGAGVELYLTPNLALRAEGLFHDRDAGSANLSLVARFGGRALALPPSPTNVRFPETATAPGGTAPPTSADPVTSSGPARPDASTLPPAPTPRRDPTAPGSPSPDAAPLPDPSTLPETLTLPRDGTAAPASPSAAPLSTPAGAGSATREAPIELPTLPAGTGLPVPDASSSPDPAPDAAPAATPAPAPASASAPASAPASTSAAPGDADGDGVADGSDTCPSSSAGYPVRDNGCAMLDGVLSGLTFVAGTAELAPDADLQLDYLAELLEEYPAARVELRAHTDDAGSVRDQSVLTRARLRTIGTYLVQQRGIRANRLVLRSFGGTRPLYDNRSSEGRAGNNRIEIVENAS